jgi:hypothetical protein
MSTVLHSVSSPEDYWVGLYGLVPLAGAAASALSHGSKYRSSASSASGGRSRSTVGGNCFGYLSHLMRVRSRKLHVLAWP